jgi:hypothetical protein
VNKHLTLGKFPFGLGVAFAVKPYGLPPASVVKGWSTKQFTDALRHDQKNPALNPSFRQLLHVRFKVAAQKGGRYRNALEKDEAVIAKNVTENLFDWRIKPLFFGK